MLLKMFQPCKADCLQGRFRVPFSAPCWSGTHFHTIASKSLMIGRVSKDSAYFLAFWIGKSPQSARVLLVLHGITLHRIKKCRKTYIFFRWIHICSAAWERLLWASHKPSYNPCQNFERGYHNISKMPLK